MTESTGMMIKGLVNGLFSNQYYYKTDKWLELQSALLEKIAKWILILVRLKILSFF